MSVSKTAAQLPPSPIKEKKKTNASSMKQGIVTILRSDPEKPKSPAASIRRTLSADMSSKKWLEGNGFPFFPPTKKKGGSVEDFGFQPDSSSSSSSSSESEEEDQNRLGRDDIWRSIQLEKQKNEIMQQSSAWGSLVLTQKSENPNSILPPPYVHPLVKRSKSTLSEKSLEICTESLGSETGSNLFSSYPSSEYSDEEKEDGHGGVAQEENNVKNSTPVEDLHVAKYKVSPVRPFPPPISSIAGGDGAGLHMHSHRENGRLVLEAVTVPPRNYFHAERCQGRLVLTMMNVVSDSLENDEVEEDEQVEVFDNMEEVGHDITKPAGDDYDNDSDSGDDDDTEEEEEEGDKNVEKEVDIFIEQKSRPGMMNVHKTGLVMKKIMAPGNKNPTWSKKIVNIIETDQDEELSIPQSLPPAPRVPRLIPSAPPATAASFNAYDYFWRNKNTVSGGFINPMITTPQSTPLKTNYNNFNGIIESENQDLVVKRGNKEEYFAPYLRACKDGRRSLLIWEPYCIATS